MTTTLIRTAAQILAAAGESSPRNFPGPKPERKDLLTTTRAARMLGVSAVHLAQLHRAGQIPRVRVNTTYYYRLADVLARMEVAS